MARLLPVAASLSLDEILIWPLDGTTFKTAAPTRSARFRTDIRLLIIPIALADTVVSRMPRR